MNGIRTTVIPGERAGSSDAGSRGLVAIDLDGTLLNSDNRPDRGAEEALSRLSQLGVSVMIASARSPRGIEAALEGIDTDGYWMCAVQGALIRAFNSDQPIPIWEHYVDPEDVMTISAAAQREGIALGAYHRSDWYVTEATPEVARESDLISQNPIVVAPELLASMDIHKLQVIVPDERIGDLARLTELLSPATVGSTSHPGYLEITSRLATKGAALEAVSSYLGLPEEATAAIGDGGNDISMVEAAGLGFAMGNATPELKARATRVLRSSNDEGGLAEAISEILDRWESTPEAALD